ncbi:lipid A export permease/ATP-binding protein MsbA [Sulfuritalea hydrogenivorans]|uniref:Lipid A export permease/ATP-binding protein MsbA n=1 Tax=Sulfuritalea hydrogenivorans sk43H TaxID=1223802 RepID=W0SKC1_9PROT|nr:lipid A export permease/ATP-binding protein MsbA [Sulfuritalea hydrogenivorans]BAO31296.1 lipid A export permease/ATP-binding protein MsbA [Sulfuritalea hydrogenivorans sk43H]
MQDSRDLYLRLLGHVRPHWKGFGLTLAATALAAATEPLFPALMKPLLDKGFGQGGNDWLAWLPLAIIGIFLLRGVAGFLASYGMSWVSNRVITDLRQLMFERLMRLPASYFDAHASSVPATRIAYDVNGVAAAATSTLTVLIRDTLSVIGLVAWLLYLNWKLTLISLAVIPLTALVVRAFSKRLRKLSLAAQEGMAQMNEVLQESIRGQKVVKIFGGEAHATSRFSRVNNALRGYGMRQAIAAAAVAPITQIFASVGLAIVVYVAMQQSAGNETTIGGFVSFITAMLLLLAPLKHLADINAPLQRGLAAAESVFRMLDEAAEVDAGTEQLGRARGEIEFAGVGLRYAGAEREALAAIDLRIRPGETVALVGPSGGGKTSLVNLVPRFYHAGSGRIRIDGHDIETLTLGSLRANIAHVGQDVFLFDDTVAANIAYGGKRDASRSEIEAAARAAHALEFIAAMPQGFDTVIGENGSRLSGGQRQRIAIARAILKDAPILILDEATSALDSESERAVQEALETLMKGRTTLVIAHRLSTVEHADRIVVLSHGRISEIGSHAELLATGGLYASLYRLQFAEAD